MPRNKGRSLVCNIVERVFINFLSSMIMSLALNFWFIRESISDCSGRQCSPLSNGQQFLIDLTRFNTDLTADPTTDLTVDSTINPTRCEDWLDSGFYLSTNSKIDPIKPFFMDNFEQATETVGVELPFEQLQFSAPPQLFGWSLGVSSRHNAGTTRLYCPSFRRCLDQTSPKN